MPRACTGAQTHSMNANKWLLLGALAGLAGVAINKQLRLTRHRRFAPLSEYSKREAQTRASIDDVPTVQGSTEAVADFDEQVAPAAPL
jgi:hypothetical protein